LLRKHWKKLIYLPLFVVVSGFFYFFCFDLAIIPNTIKLKASKKDFSNAVYVWQRKWDETVSDSIQRSVENFDLFIPLGAEIKVVGDEIAINKIPINLEIFEKINRPLCIALRAHDLPGIENKAGRDRIAKTMGAFFTEWAKVCAAHNFKRTSIQLDYDCSTENLDAYSALLELLKRDNAQIELSITTLPTWLQSDNFCNLVAALDFFVLQVHSFQMFGGIEETPSLCDTDKVTAWAKKADNCGVPFYVAWPTYGHRLHYSENGRLIALQSEENAETYAGGISHIVFAEPESIAIAARDMRSQHLDNYIGNIWFRLPIAGDTLNWTWDTLDKVMRGTVPKSEISAELRNPGPGLYEVWVKNTGNYRMKVKIALPLSWPADLNMYHDTFGDFKFNRKSALGTGQLSGTAPIANTEALAAWFRLDKSNADADGRITLYKVETIE